MEDVGKDQVEREGLVKPGRRIERGQRGVQLVGQLLKVADGQEKRRKDLPWPGREETPCRPQRLLLHTMSSVVFLLGTTVLGGILSRRLATDQESWTTGWHLKIRI